ncbi:GAF domain-containing SpoIIE family protein phosphatase [Streptomyces sp. NPDC051133]|uniref:PP2C family protein-serine/threonine phosphatase n=1 Tax=Streptomyces sp. NPDC051133 TaxID=3155521 RepID=UPI00344460AB
MCSSYQGEAGSLPYSLPIAAVPVAGPDLVASSLEAVGSLGGLSDMLARTFSWMGRVGCSLMLLEEDGARLKSFSSNNLDPNWVPSERLLESAGDWPVCCAITLGKAWAGSGRERPYPMPSVTGSAAAAVFPLPQKKGALIAIRPGFPPFSSVEQEFLASAAADVSDLLADMPRPDFSDVTSCRFRKVKMGEFSWDLETGIITGDAIFAQLHGLSAAGSYPMETIFDRMPSVQKAQAARAVGSFLGLPGPFKSTYRIAGPGGIRHLQARFSRDASNPQGAVLVGHVAEVADERSLVPTDQHRILRKLQRAEQMLVLASACAEASTTDQLAAAACDVLAVFGADAIVLAEVVNGRINLLTSYGQSAQTASSLNQMPLSISAPLMDALREQRAVFIESHEDLIAAYPHYARFAYRLDRQAWAALPIPVGQPGSPAAACMLSFDRLRLFGPRDQALLVATAGLLGRALDRCRSYDAEHTRAVQLQQALLPTALPSLPNIDLSASYLPAVTGAYAGGDWYDALRTMSGRLLLVIGDVEGHDTQAASQMGKLRTAIRAYAAITEDPADLLRHTNQLLTEDNEGDSDHARTATCYLVLLDPATLEIASANAGHPAPLLYTRGKVHDLPGRPGLPLGIFSDSQYETVQYSLDKDAQLLLYTDGLTDRRDINPNQAQRLLRMAFHRSACGDSGVTSVDRISAVCLEQARNTDDCALLLLKQH